MTYADSDNRRNETRHEVFVDVMASFGSHVNDRAMTRNVSRNGVYVATTQVIPEGFPVEVKLHLPGTSKPIFARGLVRWTTERRDPRTGEVPGFGVEFTDMSDQARLELSRFLHDRRRHGRMAG